MSNCNERELDALWRDIERADSERNVEQLGRMIPLLLARDNRIESLAHIECLFRTCNYNTHLIACALPVSFPCQSLDPRRPQSQCLYYLSINVEGSESAEKERAANISSGLSSSSSPAVIEQTNLARLVSECGFLVLDNAANLLQSTSHVVQFGSDQQVATFQSVFHRQQAVSSGDSLSSAAVCCTCRRLGTAALELRPLPCCETLLCCCNNCFDIHVESAHGDVCKEN